MKFVAVFLDIVAAGFRGCRMPLLMRLTPPDRRANIGSLQYQRNTEEKISENRDELIRVLSAFGEKILEYVLIGATAMAFHGRVRATEDVDLLIRSYSPELTELATTFWNKQSGQGENVLRHSWF